MKFEDRLGALEGIVEKLEAAEIPLEEALSLFEKGIGLVRELTAELDGVERKLEVLTRGSAGEPELRPMEESKLTAKAVSTEGGRATRGSEGSSARDRES
jgi:exodeoxyribonuclease VII small subunit